jgi:DNA modification methylase
MGAVVDDAGLTLLEGDCRALLPTLPAESVQCVVTSPPYWGLRDYGVEGQLGLEPTPEAYLAAMVGVFRAVRRVLRDDGTLWLVMGDSYSGAGYSNHTLKGHGLALRQDGGRSRHVSTAFPGLKPKDLVGMPWRLAFALQADGWYLRADIIWAKPNPMPESVTDRPTKAHEYVFLLTKSARYFYDADAVREPALREASGNVERVVANGSLGKRPADHLGASVPWTNDGTGRNLRSVWTLPTEPTPEAHFATFPSALASRCILAGTSEKGCCRACGAPWARQTDTEFVTLAHRRASRKALQPGADMADINSHDRMGFNRVTTTGWTPACPCAAPVAPCTVLDPFAGSGTVGQVAQTLGRRAVLIELSAPYVQLARTRTAQRGLFAEAAARP